MTLFVSSHSNTHFRLSSTVPEQCSDHNNHASSSNDLCFVEDDDELVRERTYLWVRRVVIGLNLCPFAKQPTRAQQLRIVVRRGMDRLALLEAVQEEIAVLVESTQPNSTCHHTTTLVVCPECYPNDFLEYLNIANDMEDAIRANPEWEGVVQLASFHPNYCFAGSPDAREPDNCTNQSPYPMFHILREMDVTRAVQQLPDQNAALVWSRNVDLLRTLHQDDDFLAMVTVPRKKEDFFQPKNPPSWVFRLRQTLRRFPIPLVRGASPDDDD